MEEKTHDFHITFLCLEQYFRSWYLRNNFSTNVKFLRPGDFYHNPFSNQVVVSCDDGLNVLFGVTNRLFFSWLAPTQLGWDPNWNYLPNVLFIAIITFKVSG